MIPRTTTVAAAAIIVTSSAMAQAATLNVVATGTDALDLIDVNEGTTLQAGAAFTASSEVEILQGNFPARGASIYRVLGDGNFETLDYFAVSNPDFDVSLGRNQAPGEATLELGGSFNTLSLIWGTPDFLNGPFINVLTLFDGTDEVASFTGAQLTAEGAIVGDPYLAEIRSDVFFDSVVFTSGDLPAFEFGNVVASVSAVPLPAGGLLLLSGLFGVAGLNRRKKRAA